MVSKLNNRLLFLCLFLVTLPFFEKNSVSAESYIKRLPPPLHGKRQNVLKEETDKYLKRFKRQKLALEASSLKDNRLRFLVEFSKKRIDRIKRGISRRNQQKRRFKNGQIEASFVNLLNSRNSFIFETFPGKRAYFVRANENELSRLLSDGIVEKYFHDMPLQKREIVPNDPQFNNQWGLKNTGQNGGTAGIDIRATQAWDISTTSNVVVAVIDTGLKINHPDISANVWTNTNEIAGNNIDDDNNGWVDDVRGANVIDFNGNITDLHGHGTAVSGVIAARGNNSTGIAGTVWNTKILPIRVFDDGGNTYFIDLIIAMEYVRLMKVRYNNNSSTGANIRVVNVSLGANFSCAATGDSTHPVDLFLHIANSAGQAGVLIAAAASNDALNHDITPTMLTSCNLTNLINVANITRLGSLHCAVPLVGGNCPAGTNRGSGYGKNTVHIAAPGTDILTLGLQNNYIYASGTSLATPFASGVAALLAGRTPSLTPAQIKNIIITKAKPLASLTNKVAANGMLDAYAAITHNMNTAPVITSHPQNRASVEGQSTTFSCSASGSPSPTYQWRRNNQNISGATSSTYAFFPSISDHSALYRCVATNSAGSTISNNATLTVTPRGDYNRNGCVDGADFIIWQKNLGAVVAPLSGADGNGDGVVGSADYAIWEANFGRCN